MDAKIIALNCPSCGNACPDQPKDRHFGLQFKCGYCGTESVLVINQQLYIPKHDEQVCSKCGRVARLGARFCQCRTPLLRKCLLCGSEFPVGDKVCDRCGAAVPIVDESDFNTFLDGVLAENGQKKGRDTEGAA